MAGTEEDKQKGRTPKENVSCEGFLGYALKKCITVIFLDGALSDRNKEFIPALMEPVIF